MAKSNYWPEGTILKDPRGHWWKVIKRNYYIACAGFYELESLDRKANGDRVIVNHGLDYVRDCMEDVTEAEKVLYGDRKFSE